MMRDSPRISQRQDESLCVKPVLYHLPPAFPAGGRVGGRPPASFTNNLYCKNYTAFSAGRGDAFGGCPALAYRVVSRNSPPSKLCAAYHGEGVSRVDRVLGAV